MVDTSSCIRSLEETICEIFEISPEEMDDCAELRFFELVAHNLWCVNELDETSLVQEGIRLKILRNAGDRYLRTRLKSVLFSSGILQEGSPAHFTLPDIQPYLIARFLKTKYQPSTSNLWSDINPLLYGMRPIRLLFALWERDSGISDLSPTIAQIEDESNLNSFHSYIACRLVASLDKVDTNFVSTLTLGLAISILRHPSFLTQLKGFGLLEEMASRHSVAFEELKDIACSELPGWKSPKDRLEAVESLLRLGHHESIDDTIRVLLEQGGLTEGSLITALRIASERPDLGLQEISHRELEALTASDSTDPSTRFRAAMLLERVDPPRLEDAELYRILDRLFPSIDLAKVFTSQEAVSIFCGSGQVRGLLEYVAFDGCAEVERRLAACESLAALGFTESAKDGLRAFSGETLTTRELFTVGNKLIKLGNIEDGVEFLRNAVNSERGDWAGLYWLKATCKLAEVGSDEERSRDLSGYARASTLRVIFRLPPILTLWRQGRRRLAVELFSPCLKEIEAKKQQTRARLSQFGVEDRGYPVPIFDEGPVQEAGLILMGEL